MKPIFTLCKIKSCVFFFVILFITNTAQSQAPIYSFKNPTLVSGTALQLYATYRFPNVISGVDALVKIQNMTSGITLLNIDRTLDGYNEAFQPEYEMAALSNASIKFRIIFVQAGTSTPAAQPLVDASGLDIDGSIYSGVTLKEFNYIDMIGGLCTFNLLNSEIGVSEVGTGFQANNITGNLFGTLVDTSATQVMYSVRSYYVDTFYYTVGANNLLPAVFPRYASLYFKRFSYPVTGVLSVSNLAGFSGDAAGGKAKLQWSLTEGNNASDIVLEKSYTSHDFQQVAEFWANMDGNTQRDFNYTDVKNSGETVFYRLKITGAGGKTEYSNVLVFHGQKSENNLFAVYPSPVQSSATIDFDAAEKQTSMLSVTDMSGRIVKRENIALQKGSNSVQVSGFEQLKKGNYIVSLNTTQQKFSKQIIVQ
jgi:hypothetical protein